MMSTQPVLLLRGSRWPVDEDFFQIFDQKIYLKQHITEIEQHEARTGLTVWDGSVALAKFFEHQKEKIQLKHKQIIELGAGVGLVGLSLATQEAFVTLTDLPDLLGPLRKNREINPNFSSFVSVESLAWGTNLNSEISNRKFDIVLASDCLWVEHLVRPFVNTLNALPLSENGEIFIAYEERAKRTEDLFFELVKPTFNVVEVSQSEMHPQFSNPYIHIFKLSKKKY